jgi:hypothetical protein
VRQQINFSPSFVVVAGFEILDPGWIKIRIRDGGINNVNDTVNIPDPQH